MIVSHRHRFIFTRPRKVAGTSLSIALEPSLGSSDVQVFAPTERRPLAGIDGDDSPAIHASKNVDALHLRDRSKPHILPSVIKEAFGDDVWRRYFKFTIIRNPWDWFVSLHVYWMRWYDFKVKREAPFFDFDGARALYHRAKVSAFFQHGRDLRLARELLHSGRTAESVEFALQRGIYSVHLAEMEQHYFLNGCRYADSYLRFENLQQDYGGLCQRLGLEHRTLPRAKTEFRPAHDDYRRYYTASSRRQIAEKCASVAESFGYGFDG